jgi:hypothetical protein
LEIAAACDAAGFRAYHVAEHHGTPHGLAASPNLFLSAVAQRTRKLISASPTCRLRSHPSKSPIHRCGTGRRSRRQPDGLRRIRSTSLVLERATRFEQLRTRTGHTGQRGQRKSCRYLAWFAWS